MIKIFKRFIELLDVKDTDYINKDGYVPKVNEALGKMELLPEGGGGQVDSIVGGTDINIDNTDPVNPIVSSTFTTPSLQQVTDVGAITTNIIKAPQFTITDSGGITTVGNILDIRNANNIRLFNLTSSARMELGSNELRLNTVSGDGNFTVRLNTASLTGESSLAFPDKDGVIALEKTVVLKSTTYTLTLGDNVILVDSTSGNITITLPTAVNNNGKQYTIKKTVAVNTVTIDTDGTETIDGALTKDLTTQYDSITVISDGANWWIIS